jgi:hypothetical protein
MSTMAIRFTDGNDVHKLLPCFTVYPMESFKTKGFYYSRKQLQENAFSAADVFDKATRDRYYET